MNKISASLSVERELKDELRVIEYEIGNGDIHFHSQIEICIVEDGQVEALINNSKKTLSRGDLAISLSYDSHRYITGESAKYSVLILPREVCENFYSAIKNKDFNTPFICGSEHSDSVMKYLSEIKKEGSDHLVRLGYVYLILGIVKEVMLDDANARGESTELLTRLLVYINENYNKDLNLKTISKAFGFHPAYVSAYFKSHINVGICRYINVIRLKHAVVLMRQGRYSITEIAMECGFAATRTFYRAFRNEFGCSPREYLSGSEHNAS